MLQVDGKDGLDDVLGKAGGQHRRQGHGQHQDDEDGLDHGQEQGREAALLTGHPQHRPVSQPLGKVQGPLREGRGVAGGGACLALQSGSHLLPVGVVLHLGGVGLVVKEDSAAGVDPGDTVGGGEAVQIIHAAHLHPTGSQGGLRLQLDQQLAAKILVQHAHEQSDREKEHRNAHQKGVAEDFRCHGCSSLLDGSDSAL